MTNKEITYFSDLLRNNHAICYAKDHFGRVNGCTIAWGMIGRIWNKEVIMVFIKPIRYTNQFLEDSEYFSLSFFDKQDGNILTTFGTVSGRNIDKIKLCNLTVSSDGGLHFKNAKITYVMRKIYAEQLEEANMINLQETINRYYTDEPFHNLFIGEIVNVIEEGRDE